MKKKILLLLYAVFAYSTFSNAQQLLNYGATITSSPNSYININSSLINTNGGIIYSNGNIFLSGDFINNGFYFSGSEDILFLNGAEQHIGGTGSITLNWLVINGTADKICDRNISIANTLQFVWNSIITGNNDISLNDGAIITGASDGSFIVTNGTGFLKKFNVPLNADFLFPVGNSVASYRPLVLNYSGVADTFSVRIESGIFPATDNDNNAVSLTYIIEESNPGNNIASLKAGWDSSDDGSSFIWENAILWQNQNNVWTAISGTPGANDNSPVTDLSYQAVGITDFSANSNRFVIANYPMPVADAGNDDTICSGESIVLTANGGLTYLWNNGETTPVIAVSPLISSSFTVTVTNEFGGTASDEVFVNVNPVYNIPQSAMVCSGSSFTFPDGTVQVITAQTIYTSNLLSVNGCDSINTSTVDVKPFPFANAGNDQTVTVGGSAVLSALGAEGSVFSWSTGQADSEITVSPLVTTTYTVTVTNDCGSASDMVTVFVYQNISIDFDASPLNVCNEYATIYQGYGTQSQALTSSVTGGVPPYTYYWSNSATSQSIIVSPSATTEYVLTVTDATGSSSSSSATVNVIDIRCGKDKVYICHKGNTLCVSVNAVPTHLANHGDCLGTCGTNSKTNTEDETEDVLVNCYPNPFSSSSTLQFSLPEDNHVKLDVYDLNGKCIQTLFDESAKKDLQYEVQFDGASFPTGVYMYQMTTNDNVYTGKMILMK